VREYDQTGIRLVRIRSYRTFNVLLDIDNSHGYSS